MALIKTDALFVYGTLLNKEVLEAVIKRAPSMQNAILPGYKCCKVKDEDYPGIRPHVGSKVEGALICGLSSKELRQLDRYEGSQYLRKNQKVYLARGRPKLCAVYVFKPMYRRLLTDEPWSNEDFRKNRMQSFLGILENEPI